jgi:hypothetical protein
MYAESGLSAAEHAEGPESTAWLTDVLDSEARRHEPDSPRIRATLYERLDGAARGRRRTSLLGLRLAGIPAGIAVAALCATVAVAVTATVESHPRTPTPTSAYGGGLPAASRSPSTDASAQPASHGTDTAVSGLSAGPSASTATGSHSSSPSASAGTGNAGLLTAVGAVDASSNGSWSQENVNITLTEPISAFQLTVKVSTSAGLSSTGDWTNYDITMFNVTVATQSDGIVYTFQLKSGRTLQPGSAEFAVQFAHGAAHNPVYDTYYASVITDKAHGSASAVSQGTF